MAVLLLLPLLLACSIRVACREEAEAEAEAEEDRWPRPGEQAAAAAAANALFSLCILLSSLLASLAPSSSLCARPCGMRDRSSSMAAPCAFSQPSRRHTSFTR